MDNTIRLFGKQHALKRIQDMYLSERFPHGIMLTGADGIGKKVLAKWCAALIFCENAENATPCFGCRSCKNLMSDGHADVIYAKGEKYTADSVRANVRLASFLPNDGNVRVFVFEDLHTMSEQCQNILLKAIEEPAKHNRYIFTCNSTSAILPTILSRVVNIPVEEMNAEQCSECLVYGGMQVADAKNAVLKLGTNPGKIKSIMSDKKQLALYDSADAVIRAITEQNEYEVAKELARFTDRQEIFSLLDILYEKISLALLPKIPDDGLLSQLKESLSLKKLYKLSEKLSEFLMQSQYNLNTKLLSANISAQLSEIFI